MEQDNPVYTPTPLAPNPPEANEPPNNPQGLTLPDTVSYTIKILDNPRAKPTVNDDEIYFFALHSVRVCVLFEQTGKAFVARVSSMRVGDFHTCLVPHIPETERKPLILEWIREGKKERRTLIRWNDLWGEVTFGLGGLNSGVENYVIVQDA